MAASIERMDITEKPIKIANPLIQPLVPIFARIQRSPDLLRNPPPMSTDYKIIPGNTIRLIRDLFIVNNWPQL